jgi:hypothetical protein
LLDTKASSRLVHDNDLCIKSNGSRNGNRLLLAAIKRSGSFLAVSNSDVLETKYFFRAGYKTNIYGDYK